MQTYIVQWQFPSMEASMKATKTFTDYVKEGSPHDSFERVLNPQGANGMAIVQLLTIQKFGSGVSLGVLALEMK